MELTGLFLLRPVAKVLNKHFGKKKDGKIVYDVSKDRTILEKNLASMNKLKVVLEANAEICGKLDGLIADYEYSSPKKSKEALKIDKRIGEHLEDIELRANKSDKNGDFTEINGLIKKIKIAIAERSGI